MKEAGNGADGVIDARIGQLPIEEPEVDSYQAVIDRLVLQAQSRLKGGELVPPFWKRWRKSLADLCEGHTSSPDATLTKLIERRVRLETLRTPTKMEGDQADRVQREGAPSSHKALEAPDKSIVQFEYSKSQFDAAEVKARKYRLDVTDVSVETALELLEGKAKRYSRFGLIAFLASLIVVLFGVVVAFDHYSQKDVGSAVSEASLLEVTPIELSHARATETVVIPLKLTDTQASDRELSDANGQQVEISNVSEWIKLLKDFSHAFTFYGFIVLTAVSLWRFGRAMLDQAERLHDRRHALRQGRLFVHLRDGQVSIDELERAFAWNIEQSNAFSNLLTEAKAPWGAIATELIKAAPALVKTGVDAAQRKKETLT